MANLVLTSTEKDRENVLASMEEKTRELAIQGGEKLTKIAAAGILLYYELGEMINEIAADETVDGDGEITKLAQYWGITNTNKLYEWRNVALNFDKTFLAEQARELLPNGREITFEHFKALRKVESETTRAKLLKKVRKESWSANDLAAEIRAGGKVNASGQGRNPSIPSSAAAIVTKCYTLSQKLYRYLDTVGAEAQSRFEELPADEASLKLLAGLQEAVEMLNYTMTEIVAFDAVLKGAQERVTTIITATKAAEDVTDASVVIEGQVAEEVEEERVRMFDTDALLDDIATVDVVKELRERTVASVVTPKKRGRPKGSKNKDSVDELTAVAAKKRGRPKGSKNKPSTD
jgi:transposase-like protein